MFHWTPEGTKLKTGLNIYFNKRYIRFIWVWVDLLEYKAKRLYFRFKYSPPMKVEFFKGEDHLPQMWLFENFLYTVTHEELEEYEIKKPFYLKTPHFKTTSTKDK